MSIVQEGINKIVQATTHGCYSFEVNPEFVQEMKQVEGEERNSS